MNLSEVTNKQAVIEELRSALKKARLSHSWAAENIGITKAHMSRVMSGRVSPSLELTVKLKALANKVVSLNLKAAI